MIIVQIPGSSQIMRYIPTYRIRTVGAIRAARRIVDAIPTGGPDGADRTETSLFRALHTCAYKAAHSNGQGNGWADNWLYVRNYLVKKNMGLAYGIALTPRFHDYDAEVIQSEAVLILLRTVERFNPWLGFRFSTYAYRSTLQSMAQVCRRLRRDRERNNIPYEEWMDPATPTPRATKHDIERVRLALDQNWANLTEREQIILHGRLPLDGNVPQGLRELGKTLGISKERIRQIQIQALKKLRIAVAPP